jgi:hypothetical protein
LHLLWWQPLGRISAEEGPWDERRKENYKVIKYFDAFAPQTVPELV